MQMPRSAHHSHALQQHCGSASKVNQQIRNRASTTAANVIQHLPILLTVVKPFHKLFHCTLKTIRPNNSENYHNNQQMIVILLKGLTNLRTLLGQWRVQRICMA